MPTPEFELFEAICEELEGRSPVVITADSFGKQVRAGEIIDSLCKRFRLQNGDDAIQAAIEWLEEHFALRGASLPFMYDKAIGRFSVINLDYVRFINWAVSIRGRGKESAAFECEVAKRLKPGLTGLLHRTGWPRKRKSKREAFVAHLQSLGFAKNVVIGKEKDAGFDIVWMPPLGGIPYRIIVSIQCKNAEFDVPTGDLSRASVIRSLERHQSIMASVNVPCVLFNDYFDDYTPRKLDRKKFEWLPLGLSDLALKTQACELTLL